MKVLGLWLATLAATLAPAAAQVSVEITTEQDQFLPAESIPLAVRITNRSGQSLHLGRSEDWLTFSVEARDAEVVPKLGEVPVAGEFELESSHVATLHVDLAPYFVLSRPGRYSVTAILRLRDWNQNVNSPAKRFDIVQGARLWEQEIGIPESGPITNTTPEVRKYILQQANYIRSQLRLYVRLTDSSESRTYRVFPLGPMVSFGRPEPQVDKFSNLHVLYQDGPRSFSYTVVNPQGEIIARRTYDLSDRRPHLQPDAEGKILVLGGVRRPTSRDIPPSKESTTTGNEVKPGPAPGEMILPDS
jgi:hypothetical protein